MSKNTLTSTSELKLNRIIDKGTKCEVWSAQYKGQDVIVCIGLSKPFENRVGQKWQSKRSGKSGTWFSNRCAEFGGFGRAKRIEGTNLGVKFDVLEYTANGNNGMDGDEDDLGI